MPLIYLSCAWILGILLGSKLELPLALILTGLIPLPLLFLLRRQTKTIILIGVCLAALFGGAFHLQSSLPTVDKAHLQFYNNGTTVALKGIVAENPEVRDKTTHLRLSAREIRVDNEWQAVSGTALLFVSRYPAYEYGDILLVTGKLETPPQLDDFDYPGYLAHQGIYSTMLYPRAEILEKDKGFKPLAWIYSLRNSLSRTLTVVLPEPQASLAQGIVLGIRSTIPTSIKADLSLTGTAHLLAISGLHLSIVAGIMLAIGIWLFGRRHYIYVWLALAIIWLYVLLTGMHPPVVRGAIMASLFLSAELLGRQRSAMTALTFAAAVMIGLTPQILWTASFQLSFLAMTGLILLTPSLQSLGRKAIHATLGEEGAAVSLAAVITDSFSVTLGAIIAVWPVIAYYFGIISFVGPLATLLALPALPGIIVTGALASLLGLIALSVAQAVGWLAWLFLSYMLLVVSGFATLPFSSIEVGPVDIALIWIYYPAVAIAIWLSSNRKKLSDLIPETAARLKSRASRSFALMPRLPKKWAMPPLLVIAILVSFTAATMPDKNLHVSFLDVGEGDAILVQTPAHQNILIDGGPSPQAINLGLSDKMPFWDRTIDLIVLTHPHTDHLAGLVEVLHRYKVRQVLAPDLNYASPLYDEWLNLIEEKDIILTTARAGQQIDLGAGATIKVLNPRIPPLVGTASDIDNNGVVLQLNLGRVSFLLTSDIGQDAEFDLMSRRADLASTVLKVAHHGSDTSTSQEFLAVANPHLAVISVGEDNRFGHPSDEVMGRLEERLGSENIYRTDRHGSVEFITDGKRLWVKREK